MNRASPTPRFVSLLGSCCALAAIAVGSTDRAHARPAPKAAPLVELQRLIPDLRVELRYAGKRNMFHRAVYPRAARALLCKPVAERLARVQRRLQARGVGLKIWDAYRPIAVQWMLWRLQPDRRYVADPRRGSDHNRGAAVDLTLVELASGRELAMPTDHDVTSPRARVGARRGVSANARKNAALLRREMRRAGFRELRSEWWHFSAPEAKRYPLAHAPLVANAAPKEP